MPVTSEVLVLIPDKARLYVIDCTTLFHSIALFQGLQFPPAPHLSIEPMSKLTLRSQFIFLRDALRQSTLFWGSPYHSIIMDPHSPWSIELETELSCAFSYNFTLMQANYATSGLLIVLRMFYDTQMTILRLTNQRFMNRPLFPLHDFSPTRLMTTQDGLRFIGLPLRFPL